MPSPTGAIQFPEILVNSRFFLELKLAGASGPADGYFMECQGFQASQDVIEIAEVASQGGGTTSYGVVRTKIPGNMKYTNITLKRGLMASMSLWNWLQMTQQNQWGRQRQSGFLYIYGAQVQLFKLQFDGAWPVSYKISDLSASGQDLEIEELEMAVEKLIRLPI